MKNYLIALAAAGTLFASCNTAELKQLNDEKQRLVNEANAKDSTINSLLESFNDIENNLAVIKEKENVIEVKTKQNGEFKEDTRQKIQQDIQVINDLMAQNKAKISELNSRVKNSGVKISALEKMIDSFKRQVEEKETEIAGLKEQLVSLNFTVSSLNSTVDTLTRQNQEKSTVINTKVNELNTAYYIIDSPRGLKDKGVVTKEGGFIGIGRVKKLSTKFPPEQFTKIDIRNTNSFELGGHSAKFITTHPAGSYKFEPNEKNASRLVITDAEKFWEASKYMVVQID